MKIVRDRVVSLWGDEITLYQTDVLRKRFEELLLKDVEETITFQIMSSGGRCDAGFALYDWLGQNVLNLQTVAYGQVNSMAVILFAAGEVRVATKHSSFYLHPVQSVHEKGTTLDETGHKNAVESLRTTQSQYLDVLSSVAQGRDKDALLRMIKKQTTITAKLAFEIGLATELV